MSMDLCTYTCIRVQEMIQVTKLKMLAAVQDKIRRLHEDKIIAELTKGLLDSL